MNYKELKQLIKAAQRKNDQGEDCKAELAKFFFTLDRHVERVNDFYNKQYAEYDRRLKRVSAILNAGHPHTPSDKDEVEEEVGVLLELRHSLRNLIWFGELNKRGITKILKKCDKKTGTSQQQSYLATRVDALPFANEQEIKSDLQVMSLLLSRVSSRDTTPTTLGAVDPSSMKSSTSVVTSSSSKYMPLILEDDGTGLQDALVEQYCSPILAPARLLVSLLNKAALQPSLKCIDTLLEISPVIADPADISGRNFFHHHVIAMGKPHSGPESIAPAHPPLDKKRINFGPDGINAKDSYEGLLEVLHCLPVHLRSLLLQKDHHRRTPLHYAAQFGLKGATSIIVHHMKLWNLYQPNISFDDISMWADTEVLTPLHLAVLGKHPKTTKVLLDSSEAVLTNQRLLLLAARMDSPELLQLLLEYPGTDIDFCDPDTHETALYIACKSNLMGSVEFLLSKGASTEIRESAFGWTPVFAAATEGLEKVVEALLKNKANADIADDSGWTPMEHACLRGHVKLASMLETTKMETCSIVEREDEPQTKSFGHMYLESEALIMLTFGSMDLRDKHPAVEFERVPMSRAHTTELDTALSVVVSVKGLEAPPVVLDLPLEDNYGSATDPLTFRCGVEQAEKAVVLFDIVPTYQSKEKSRVLGRGVAMLSSAYTELGDQRRSLHGTLVVPILETGTLELLGSVRFEVLVARPFHHERMNVGRAETYWRSLVSTRVIGHRGLGKNSARNSLQLGENTVESFIAAASLGASYVEFDVQLTKDHVPVIYHDFLVAESGLDVPMHALTAEQFLQLNSRAQGKVAYTRRKSLDDQALHYQKHSSLPIDERMKLTRTWKAKQFKGNARGTSIASPFVTLKDLFRKLPKTVGFNIELKYPMLDEAQSEDMGLVGVDLNFFVDTVLKVVYDHSEGRDIILSSFHPDVCLLLSLKQPSIPVMFLTDAGTEAIADVRAASLQSAIRFAKKWNLLGIVSAAQPLVMCPRLAGIVKASGLVCVTYGVLNNDPNKANSQLQAGVDAVIVDSVLAVRQGLRSNRDEVKAVSSQLEKLAV